MDFLSDSLDKSNLEPKASETQDEEGETSSVSQSGMLNQTLDLPRIMEKLKTNPDIEFETARKRFKEACKTATTAFWTEAFSLEARIFAAKLRIVSEILEHLNNLETAISWCRSFINVLHSLPAIQELFSVYLNGGDKLFNKKNPTRGKRQISETSI